MGIYLVQNYKKDKNRKFDLKSQKIDKAPHDVGRWQNKNGGDVSILPINWYLGFSLCFLFLPITHASFETIKRTPLLFKLRFTLDMISSICYFNKATTQNGEATGSACWQRETAWLLA